MEKATTELAKKIEKLQKSARVDGIKIESVSLDFDYGCCDNAFTVMGVEVERKKTKESKKIYSAVLRPGSSEVKIKSHIGITDLISLYVDVLMESDWSAKLNVIRDNDLEIHCFHWQGGEVKQSAPPEDNLLKQVHKILWGDN